MMRNKAETWKRYYESIVIRGKFQNPAIKADFERLFRYWKDSREKMPMAEWQMMQNNWGDLAGKVSKDVNDTWRDFCNLFAGNCVQSASEDKYIDPEFIAALQEVFGETPPKKVTPPQKVTPPPKKVTPPKTKTVPPPKTETPPKPETETKPEDETRVFAKFIHFGSAVTSFMLFVLTFVVLNFDIYAEFLLLFAGIVPLWLLIKAAVKYKIKFFPALCNIGFFCLISLAFAFLMTTDLPRRTIGSILAILPLLTMTGQIITLKSIRFISIYPCLLFSILFFTHITDLKDVHRPQFKFISNSAGQPETKHPSGNVNNPPSPTLPRKQETGEQPLKVVSTVDTDIYVVKAGDYPAKIAGKLGVSISDLLKANNMTAEESKKIRIGQRLLVPKKNSGKQAELPKKASPGKAEKTTPAKDSIAPTVVEEKDISKPVAAPEAEKTVSNSAKSNIFEMQQNFELMIGAFSPEQQNALRNCLRCLLLMEELFSNPKYRKKPEQQNLLKKIQTLCRQIFTVDKTAWESLAYGIFPEIQDAVKKNTPRNFDVLSRQLIRDYQIRTQEKQNYRSGINVKIWTGRNHRLWSDEFFNFKDASFVRYGMTDIELFNLKKQYFPETKSAWLTTCYEGWIYVPAIQKYEFQVQYVLQNQRLPLYGNYAVYLDGNITAQSISETSAKKQLPKKFSVALTRGFHKLTLIKEVFKSRPGNGHLQISFRSSSNGKFTTLTAGHFYYLDNQNTLAVSPVAPAPAAPAAPTESVRADLEKRFKDIIRSTPLRVKLSSFVSTAFDPRNVSGTALKWQPSTAYDDNNDSNIVKSPYRINLQKYLFPARRQKGMYLMSLNWNPARNSAYKSVFRGSIPITRLRENIFAQKNSEKVINAMLEALQKKTSLFAFYHYLVDLHIKSYSEEHKLLQQQLSQVKFSIRCNLVVAARITNSMSGKVETIEYPLHVYVPARTVNLIHGLRQTTHSNTSYRDQTFHTFGMLLGDSLIQDLRKKHKNAL